MEKTKRVILVSGMSGAGKSTATRILEDMGYHIIDNFPVQLLSLLVDMIENSTDPRYSYNPQNPSDAAEQYGKHTGRSHRRRAYDAQQGHQ